jgi:glycerate 2-kinase
LKLGEDALRIAKAGIAGVRPDRWVTRRLSLQNGVLRAGSRRLRLQARGRLLVIAIGKAAHPMALAAERALGPHIDGGLVVGRKGGPPYPGRLPVQDGSHPIPDEESRRAAQAARALVSRAEPNDTILYLISGGGSACFEAPAEGIPFPDLRRLHGILVDSDLPIQDINTLRRHVSAVKGGHLAALAGTRRQVTLALSDVVGDEPAAISSGPTVPDPSRFREAKEALQHLRKRAKVPLTIGRYIDQGIRGRVPETPKPGDPRLKGCSFELLAGNRQALRAAQAAARRRGYRGVILSSEVTGETRDVALVHAAIARQIAIHREPWAPPVCVLSGGETTVTLRGNGKGGRNQEFVLASARGISGLPDVVVLSLGTDGIDGPTDAAGGWVDGKTWERARKRGLSLRALLARNDSYTALRKLGQLIRTGPTGTNVMDIHVVLVGQPKPPGSRSVDRWVRGGKVRS